jgi:hypothetical protein
MTAAFLYHQLVKHKFHAPSSVPGLLSCGLDNNLTIVLTALVAPSWVLLMRLVSDLGD